MTKLSKRASIRAAVNMIVISGGIKEAGVPQGFDVVTSFTGVPDEVQQVMREAKSGNTRLGRVVLSRVAAYNRRLG